MQLEPGAVIHDRYRIEAAVGDGGMGTVYEGRHIRTQRRVAVKVLHGRAREGDEAYQRFELEAQAAARIGSEHVVDVIDFGHLDDGSPYMVMEYCDGESLRDRFVRCAPIAAPALLPIIVQLLEGLEAAHAAGVVHRDLKPSNVFLLSERPGLPADFVKILDFGVSKFFEVPGRPRTRTGQLLGTPMYMAPEQVLGESSVDRRADIYAVGVILYGGLSAAQPFPAKSDAELVMKTLSSNPIPLVKAAPEVDPRLAAIVHHAMARDPEERPQSAAALAGLLTGWLEGTQEGVPMSDTQIAETVSHGAVSAIKAQPTLVEAPPTRISALHASSEPTLAAAAPSSGSLPTQVDTPAVTRSAAQAPPAHVAKTEPRAAATSEGATVPTTPIRAAQSSASSARTAATTTPMSAHPTPSTPVPISGGPASDASSASPQVRRISYVGLAVGAFLLAVGVFLAAIVLFVFQQMYLQPAQQVDFRRPDEIGGGRRAHLRGVCLMSEVRVFREELFGEPYEQCVFPIVSESDFAALRGKQGGGPLPSPDYRRIKVVGAIYCYQLDLEFGEAAARAKGGIPCEIDGVWNAVENNDSLGAQRVRSSFPGLQGAFVLESPPEMWGFWVFVVVCLLLCIAGGWLMRRSLTRKPRVGDELRSRA